MRPHGSSSIQAPNCDCALTSPARSLRKPYELRVRRATISSILCGTLRASKVPPTLSPIAHVLLAACPPRDLYCVTVSRLWSRKIARAGIRCDGGTACAGSCSWLTRQARGVGANPCVRPRGEDRHRCLPLRWCLPKVFGGERGGEPFCRERVPPEGDAPPGRLYRHVSRAATHRIHRQMGSTLMPASSA